MTPKNTMPTTAAETHAIVSEASQTVADPFGRLPANSSTPPPLADPAKASAEQVAALTNRLAAIIESSDDAVISKNLDSIIQTWNQGAEKIFGYSAAEVIGKSITILIPEDHQDEEPTILARLRRGERIDHYETIRRRKDGKLIDISLTVSPIKNSAGAVIGASKIARDITDRKLVEAELARAKEAAERANRAKDNFLAILSHELRTPLNPVLLLASDAAANPDFSPSVRTIFDAIRRNVEIEARLIDDLLDVSRVSSGKLKLNHEHVDVADLVRTTLTMLRREFDHKRLVLDQDLPASPAFVLGDKVRLQQVIWNVLKNAVKFTPVSGTVTVRLSVVENEICLVVSDTGIGMTPPELACAFDAFRRGNSEYSQKHGGLGLGLTLGKSLVEQHGGNIQAASPGRDLGSAFTITLPLAVQRQLNNGETVARTSAAPSPTHPVSRKILLVEDHESTREALRTLLARRDYKVTTAASLNEAVACAARENFDVLISDIGLPDGNGNELFAQLRAHSPLLQGIALTGFGMEDDVERSKNVGFLVHLTKPINIESLEQALARI